MTQPRDEPANEGTFTAEQIQLMQTTINNLKVERDRFKNDLIKLTMLDRNIEKVQEDEDHKLDVRAALTGLLVQNERPPEDDIDLAFYYADKMAETRKARREMDERLKILEINERREK